MSVISSQFSAIGIPVEFTESLAAQQEAVLRIKSQMAAVIGDVTASAAAASTTPGGASEDDKKEAKSVASAAVSRKFMVSRPWPWKYTQS